MSYQQRCSPVLKMNVCPPTVPAATRFPSGDMAKRDKPSLGAFRTINCSPVTEYT